MADYLKKRGGVYSYRRRVPREMRAHESQEEIVISLKTDSETEARAKAQLVNAEIERRWAAFQQADKGGANERWLAAQELARSFGVSYLPAGKLIEMDVRTIGDRLDRLEARGKIGNPLAAAALLGGVDQPEIMLSDLLAKYWSLTRDVQALKSKDQLRRWKNPRIKAFKNFMNVVGDISLNQLSRDHVLNFRDEWMDRIVEGGLTANSANKDFTHISHMVRTVAEAHRIDIDDVFSKLRFRENQSIKRPAYSAHFLETRVLAKGVMADLNEDCRLIVYVMIETGMRPVEIANLTANQIKLEHQYPHLDLRQTNRQLKSENAYRVIPLVGVALWAMKQRAEGFPDYFDRETQASSNINKFFRNNDLKESEQHTLYSIRGSFQDRLIATRHPELGQITERVQADLMGHSTDRPKYGGGASLEDLHAYLSHMAFSLPLWAK